MQVWKKQASPMLSAIVLIWGVIIASLVLVIYFRVHDELNLSAGVVSSVNQEVSE